LNYFDRCPVGTIKSSDGKSCEQIDDCDNNNCMKDERHCLTSSPGQLCSCSDNSTACNRNSDNLTINLNTIAISAMIVCVINIPRKIPLIHK